MQVAKYWRNNQLRYRLQGVVQQKIETITTTHPATESAKQNLQTIELQDKVKIA